MGPASQAQDPEIRRQAVQLLEKANRVSLSPNLPNLERQDTFRVLDSTTGAQEGTFTRVVVQGVGRRDETKFGDYHVIDVWTGDRLATTRTSELAPAEVTRLMRLTPISHVSFDAEDVIHAIVNKAAGGRTLRCIEFDTIRGETSQYNNEVCVDVVNGTLAATKLGETLVEYSDFFPFAGSLMPGKIVYSHAGLRNLEISQIMTELTDASENVLAAPPNAQLRQRCKTWRRPIGESMPQPKPGNGGRNTDVVIRGIIGTDGKIHEAVVQSVTEPELGAEALSLVRQWVFSPEMCNGNPNPTAADLIVHFRGR
jgi:hypothetical protein